MQIVQCYFITLFALHVLDVIHIHPQERYKMYMQMVQVPVPSACTFYIAPEDGCVLHPKHVEQIV